MLQLTSYITLRTKESFLSDGILAPKIAQRKHNVRKGYTINPGHHLAMASFSRFFGRKTENDEN